MIVTFVVPFVVPKARPRFSGHAYTPKRTRDAEKAIFDAYRDASVRKYGSVVCAPENVPVTVAMSIRKAAPKGRPKWLPKALWDAGRYAFTQQPDYDNCAKLVCDAINGVAWVDDAQITEAHIYKLDRARGSQDMTHVLVMWRGEEE